jgi:3-deoxy-manno-octulosonate cytidylyltransferase (CMP-KDO synthetase)
MPAINMTQVAANLASRECSMATLHKEIDAIEAEDPNQVKLVPDHEGHALYFSRSVIPYNRSGEVRQYCGHIGIYAYRVEFIEIFSGLAPCDLEIAESLEQLRALCNGYSIHSEIAHAIPGPGVDTEEDLARVEKLMDSVPA